MNKIFKTKVLVTGGAGFIGSNLVDALVELGYDVHIIDNLSGGKRENVNKKARLHIKDITHIKEMETLFKGVHYAVSYTHLDVYKRQGDNYLKCLLYMV